MNDERVWWVRLETWPNYEVSSEGQVRNVESGNILSPATRKDGNVQVNLRHKGYSKTVLVSRLMAEAFGDGEVGYLTHVDGNKGNNSMDNLSEKTNGPDTLGTLFRLRTNEGSSGNE